MQHLYSILLVGVGGFVGSAARHSVSLLTKRVAPALVLPWETIVVNLIGCLAIGLLAGAIHERQSWSWSSETQLLVFAGILGGFTTFSAFGLESFSFLKDGHMIQAGAYLAVQILGGLLAVWAGYTLTK